MNHHESTVYNYILYNSYALVIFPQHWKLEQLEVLNRKSFGAIQDGPQIRSTRPQGFKSKTHIVQSQGYQVSNKNGLQDFPNRFLTRFVKIQDAWRSLPQKTRLPDVKTKRMLRRFSWESFKDKVQKVPNYRSRFPKFKRLDDWVEIDVEFSLTSFSRESNHLSGRAHHCRRLWNHRHRMTEWQSHRGVRS